tara:strand:+ start:734 stop:982 length:249 start_codon:yes stop_codon:yes gene_type:complete
MVKKCIVCSEEAEFKIKDTSDYYCKPCAEENFADLTMLVTMEEEAQRLKEYLKEKMEDLTKSDEELDQIIQVNEESADKEEE